MQTLCVLTHTAHTDMHSSHTFTHTAHTYSHTVHTYSHPHIIHTHTVHTYSHPHTVHTHTHTVHTHTHIHTVNTYSHPHTVHTYTHTVHTYSHTQFTHIYIHTVHTYSHTHSYDTIHSFSLWLITRYWTQFPVWHRSTLLFLRSALNPLHLPSLDSRSIALPAPFLGNHKSALYVHLSQFHKFIPLCPILDCKCKWGHVVFVFFLTYFTWYDNHPCCCNSIISFFFLWLSVYMCHMVFYPFTRWWTFNLFSSLGCCEHHCCEHSAARISEFCLVQVCAGVGLLDQTSLAVSSAWIT